MNIKNWCLAVLIFTSVTPGYSQLKPEDVKSFTLPNDMKFLVIEDFSIPNANMYLFWKVGSRNEYPGITGLSHFFEHMMFNGSKKYGPKQFDKTMEFNGGANNAYTSQNLTVYTDWFPAKAMEVIFDLEADRIRDLAIDTQMVESERGVVSSEKSTGLENEPKSELYELMYATAYTTHSYRWPVIGYFEDIKNWSKEDLESYFKTYYSPNNCLVVVSGAVKFDQVKAMAEKYLGNIPKNKQAKPMNLVEPEQKGERRVFVKKDVPTFNMMMSHHLPATGTADYYALDLLDAILTNGRSSRLYKAVIDSLQLATEISSYTDNGFDPSLMLIDATGAKDKDPLLLEKTINDVIEKIKTEGVTAEELQKVKNQKLINFYGQIETINGKSNNIGIYELFFGDYKKMFDAPKEYEKVTLEDIKRVTKTYLKKSNRTVGIMSPLVED
ncbi:MAG: insulinase family protein [Chitinophagaceae bacterium]|nr:MAG: insulinase family protein [Chitinophagaceae bacterium]